MSVPSDEASDITSARHLPLRASKLGRRPYTLRVPLQLRRRLLNQFTQNQPAAFGSVGVSRPLDRQAPAILVVDDEQARLRPIHHRLDAIIDVAAFADVGIEPDVGLEMP